jgi:hypothetical protein
MTAHAKLSPSGSKRWFACPGSLVLEAPIPNKSNTYSDDGTAMHDIAARCLTMHYQATKYIGEDVPVHHEGEPERFVEFTDEMAELVQGYVDTVRVIGIGNEVHIEKRVDFSEFVQLPDSFGTADAIVVDDRAGELVLIDLKTGHTPVVVEENSQLMLYALGVLAMLATGDQVPVGPAPKDEEECDLV